MCHTPTRWPLSPHLQRLSPLSLRVRVLSSSRIRLIPHMLHSHGASRLPWWQQTGVRRHLCQIARAGFLLSLTLTALQLTTRAHAHAPHGGTPVGTRASMLPVGSWKHLPNAPTAAELASNAPEQVKLALTQREGELVFNWLTWNPVAAPVVKYGYASGSYTATVPAATLNFVDPNSMHVTRYIQNALATGLKGSATIFYIVGDAASGTFSTEMVAFTQPTVHESTAVQVMAVFGDLGVTNSQSMQYLSVEVANGAIQIVLHVGDYGYNLDDFNGQKGDIFLRDMQNITQ